MGLDSTLLERRYLGARYIRGKRARKAVLAKLRAVKAAEALRKGWDLEAAERCRGSLRVYRVGQEPAC